MLALLVSSKKAFPSLRSQRFTPVFSSSGFIVLALVFRYMTLGLIVSCVSMVVWVVGQALLRIFKLQVSGVSAVHSMGSLLFVFYKESEYTSFSMNWVTGA